MLRSHLALPPRRSLLLAALLVPAGVLPGDRLTGSLAVAGECPHQGRSPQTIQVPPVTSSTSMICNERRDVSSGGVSGSVQESWRCPTWETTGLNYNPIVAKANTEVKETQYVENKRIALRCSSKRILWGVYSRQHCEDYREDVIEVQIHALSESMCASAVATP